MKILLTGFGPFGDIQVNPSQMVVEELARRGALTKDNQLITEILPVEFLAAGERVQDLICQNEPDTVVSLGVAAGRSKLSFERVALNLDDSTFPDNAGFCPQGSHISSKGPPAYFSTLPLIYLQEKLAEKGVSTIISNHAGTYVCNHVFYVAAHQVNKLGLNTLYGFVHVPLVASKENPVDDPKMTLEELVAAIEYCLQQIRGFLEPQ